MANVFNKSILINFYCNNKKCKLHNVEIEDFDDEILYCKKCKRKLKRSSMMNRTLEGVRDFRHVDQRR